MQEKDKKYPEGYFVGKWMGIITVIFSGLGIPLSLVTENPGFIGVGPAIGVSLGLAIGQSIEDKHKKEGKIRPLTKEEKKKKKMLILALLAMLVIGVLTALMFFLM